VATQYWVLGGRRAYLLKLCHLERSRAASPGTALTALMVRHLIEVDGSRELDFGRGDDDYKQLWVKERRQRHGVLLASPWHPLGMVAIVRHRASSWLRARRGAA
jgi:CelD/BcsL family acetyltransferase involved in cellulose biosynthesis